VPALLLTHGFPPDVGGIQTYLHARCLATPGEIAVVAPDRPGAAAFDRDQPFPVWRWATPPGLARPAQIVGPLIGGSRLARRLEVEWLEAGTVLPSGFAAYRLARRLRRPYLVWTHGQELFRAQQLPWNLLGGTDRLMRFLLGNAHAVMANSHATADLVEGLGVPRSSIHVLPPGLLPGSEDAAAAEGPGLRERFGLGDRPLVVSVGRLVPRKGHDLLLQAVALARRESPELACVIVGDGPERPELEGEIEALGLSGHAFLPGRLTEGALAEAYAAGTLFALLPRHDLTRGWWEGFGIVFKEAGSHGLPVVGTRAGGIPDAVEHERTGLLVEPGDTAAAAAAILQLVRNPELARRLGEAGREHAHDQPEWQTIRTAMTARHSGA
jgi:phosphatidylinositol alpha-1,6-mannosyltransferase